jgi:D-alanyl-D-alanine carboxypeptidase/D-alanyl-D-alanine-endopeptidase (penicillin-binding protein 4)
VIRIVSVSVTVTMVLLVCWQWALASTTLDAEPAIISPADPTVRLETPLLSFRRAPGILSRDVNSLEFRIQASSLVDEIGTGSCLQVAVAGSSILSVHPDTVVIPASNQKLLVASAALELLGPDYRFTTTATGVMSDDGVIEGDLSIVGGGDPQLVTDAWLATTTQTYPPIGVTSLDDLADMLVRSGLKRVGGQIVGDGTRFDDQRFHPAWPEEIRGREAGPIGALMVNDSWLGPTAYDGFTTDPALLVAQRFGELLVERGVSLGGDAVSGEARSDQALAVVQSRSLDNVISEMLLTSDDNTAEVIVKELGYLYGGIGSTSAGLGLVQNHLLSLIPELDDFVLSDGSGLSRENRLTCGSIVAVLASLQDRSVSGLSLPVAGVSGTLRDQFIGTPMEMRLRAKTGTLADVKALSGFVPTPGGEVIFSLIINEPGADRDYLTYWNTLGTLLDSYGSVAPIEALLPR